MTGQDFDHPGEGFAYALSMRHDNEYRQARQKAYPDGLLCYEEVGNTEGSSCNTFTGALSSAVYRADVNLDRKFDDSDTVRDKHLYCLISPSSFSCGNLLPSVFKNSQDVTLIGKTSGGGSCVVRPLSTASGTLFQISGPNRLAFTKNGSFYNIDQGMEPDVYIDDIDHYYDREALTEFINNIY